jgi:hypothetical protein
LARVMYWTELEKPNPLKSLKRWFMKLSIMLQSSSNNFQHCLSLVSALYFSLHSMYKA